MTSTQQFSSLFSSVGGPNAVRAIIDELDKLVSNDAEIMHFFDGVRFSLLKVHHLFFLRMALEGLSSSAERSILLQHKRLFLEKGLNEDHINLLSHYLLEALRRCHTAKELVEVAAENLSQMQEIFEDAIIKCKYILPVSDFNTTQAYTFKNSSKVLKKQVGSSLGGTLRHISSPSAHAA